MLRQLERYDVLSEIAHGGMATVYQARDTKLDRMVALKVMHPHLRGAQEARSRFAQEARTIAKLHHPNIIEIYDFSGKDSEEVYIATELLTGPTLKGFLDSHANIPAEIAACFAIHIARALIASHREGVVHRDVKPENVLIHQNRLIKLTDFGLAQMRDTHSMTITGQILGSPGYMAPEQVESKECDARTDIFSLGAVLYVLSVGELPFSARTPHKVLMQIAQGEYVDPLRKRPSIGAKLAAIIRRCMQTAPEARYSNAEELEQDLSMFLSEMGIDDPTHQLEAYLSAPDTEAHALHARSIERLITLGHAACVERNYPIARDYYDRVLALEPGHPQVLEALIRLGKTQKKHHIAWIVGVFLGVAACGLAAWMWVVPRKSLHKEQKTSVTETKSSPSGAKSSHALIGASEQAAAPTPEEKEHKVSKKTTKSLNTSRLRLVVFRPSPQNVTIGIDNEPLRSFGPDFQEVHLEPGNHRFRIIGAQECCIDQNFTLRIPAGDTPYVLERTLKLRPSILVVRSNVPADVVVGNGAIKGRSHSALVVDVGDSFRSVQRIMVSAPDRTSVERSVVLEAGKVTEIDVTLSPP